MTLPLIYSLRFMFLNFLFVCQNISACLKLNRPRVVIVYRYIIVPLYPQGRSKPATTLSVKYFPRNLQQTSYRLVFDVVMHSNKITGPKWRIYSKTAVTFELV